MTSHHKNFSATPFARQVAERIAIALTPSKNRPRPDFNAAAIAIVDAKKRYIETVKLSPMQWMEECLANVPDFPQAILGTLEREADVFLVGHLVRRLPFGFGEMPMIGDTRQDQARAALKAIGIKWPVPNPQR